MIDRSLKILVGLLVCLPLAHAQMGMPSQAPTPHKKKKAADSRDPSISRALPAAKMDAESEAALKRSGRSGVFMAELALPGKIYEIRVVGAQKVEADAVLVLLKTRIGSFVDPAVIAEDIRQIFKMGLFSDIQVEDDKGPNQSVILSYRLKEKPTIFKVRFMGEEDLSEDDLKEAVDLKSYQIADMGRIKENAEKIRKLYLDKGFLLAHVAYEVKPTPQDEIKTEEQNKAPDFVDVIFHIEEESKTRVEHISILGNLEISTDDIKSHMRTKEKHPLSFVTQWGVFNEDMLEIDGLIIEQLYQEHGFLNVQVSKPRATLSPDKTRISAYISIIEGQQYKLGHLEVGGNLLDHTEEVLRKKVTLETGDIFNRVQLGQNISAIQEVYQDEGYAYVNISPETHINDNELSVDLKLEIDPGPLVHFGQFHFKGNSTTMDEVIRRELRVYEGELYSASLLRLSEQRLNQLGYFESVKFSSKPGDAPDIMDVEVEVKEKRLGSIQIGGGYGTGGEGFVFQSQISQNNLFGRGQALMGSVQWSSYRRIFEIQFVDPYIGYIGDAPLSLSLRLYDTQRFFMDYYRSSTGGEVSLGYPIGYFLRGVSTRWFEEASPALEPYVPDFENLRFFLSYTGERVTIDTNRDGVNYWGWYLNQPRYTTSLRPVIQMDQRNNRIFPTAGYFLEFRTEFATSYLGSILLADLENKIAHNSKTTGLDAGLNFLKQDAEPNNFIRYGSTLRFYYNFDRWFFLKNWVFKLNWDFGLVDTFGKALISENYRLGGVQLGSVAGLRGYYFQSIGPVINVGQQFSAQPVQQLTIGGNKQLLINLELEFPIVRAVNLFGVFFFDMGNVYGPGEGFFYAGNQDIHTRYPGFSDPLGTFYGLGLYSSAGFGVRWVSPMGPLRFEWGFPIVKRPHGTPGIPGGDSAMQFLFTLGQSF